MNYLIIESGLADLYPPQHDSYSFGEECEGLGSFASFLDAVNRFNNCEHHPDVWAEFYVVENGEKRQLSWLDFVINEEHVITAVSGFLIEEELPFGTPTTPWVEEEHPIPEVEWCPEENCYLPVE